VLGHEGAGVVTAVGSAVDDLAVGDHVILSWTPSCRKCEFCVSGNPVLCQLANETAYGQVFFDGKSRLRDGEQDVKSDQEKKLIGSNYGSSRQSIDFPKIIDLYMEGLVDLDSMVTDRIALDQVNEAFAQMRQGRGIRSVIEY
jgi:Zn-dependent alcohol dehydrogenase